MPNWCSNNIVIEGPKEKVETIWSRATDDTEEGLLGALHPIGEWDYHCLLYTSQSPRDQRGYRIASYS